MKSVKERLQQIDDGLVTEFEAADAEDLSYDFFKNLASLSVLTLGGVLTLSESVFVDRVEPWMMFLTGGFIAAAGLLALQCQAEIVQLSRGKKPPSNFLRFGHRLAPGLFGGGIGGFLAMLGTGYLL